MNAKLVAHLSQKSAAADRGGDTQIQFNPMALDRFNATLPTGTFTVAVTNAVGAISKNTDVKQVQIDIIASVGSASGRKLEHGGTTGAVDASITVPLVDGKATVIMKPTGNGTFRAGLNNAFNNALVNSETGLNYMTTDTVTATFA